MYTIYSNGKIVADCVSPEAAFHLIRLMDTSANDGPEVDIINRENKIDTEEFFCS